MFERYNNQARAAILSSAEQARALKNTYVGPEHLLLAIIHNPGSLAAKVLESLGVKLDVVRQEVKEMTGEGSGESGDNVPYTPRAKEVLGLALREALVLGHQHIGTEHLLLGLIREEESVAARILIEQGAHLEKARQHVVMVLASQPASPGPMVQDIKTYRTGYRNREAIVSECGERTERHARQAWEAEVMVFENFNERARRAVVTAQEEARALHHDFIGTEHILLGLLGAGGGVADVVLRSLSVDAEEVRAEIVRIIGPYNALMAEGNIPFTKNAKQVITNTIRAAEHLGHGYVGTEHLLLGLIDHASCLGTQVLATMYADLPAIREATMRELQSMGVVDSTACWQLLALPAVEETLAGQLSLRPAGVGATCMKTPAPSPTPQIDLLAIIREVSGNTIKASLGRDSYDFTWLTFRQAEPDLGDLANALRKLNLKFTEAGHESALLCSLTAFNGPGRRRLAAVYLNRKGTFYPFAPIASDRRDNSLELDFKKFTSSMIPIEPELSMWFPVWDAPGL